MEITIQYKGDNSMITNLTGSQTLNVLHELACTGYKHPYLHDAMEHARCLANAEAEDAQEGGDV